MKTIKYLIVLSVFAVSNNAFCIWNSSSFASDNYSFIFRFETQMLCTATLLSPKVAITAAHCFSEFDYSSNKKFRATNFKDEDLGIIRFKKIIFHPQFNMDNLQNGTIPASEVAYDMALIILPDGSKSLNGSTPSLTEKWGSLSIADFNISPTDSVLGLGLGNMNDNGHYAELGAINLKSTGILNSSNSILNFNPIKSGQSMCPGDSGGPIFKTSKNGSTLIGHLSGKLNTRTGSDAKNARPCEDDHHTFFVTNFFMNRQWITSAINEN